MWSWLKKWSRRLALGGALIGVFGGAAPIVYEGYVHNEGQQDRVENAVNKIVQEQFFTTDAAAAGQFKDTRDAKLLEITTAAAGTLNPGWSHPVDLFQSGVKRMTNSSPAVSKVIAPRLGFGDEYYNGNYKTAFDDMADYIVALATQHVGVVFDNSLTKLNIGSAYTRDQGIISINPELSQGDMVEHMRRHLLRLNQEVVLPYERVVKTGNNLTGAFADRTGQLRVMVATFDGPVVTLPLVNGANAEFGELPRKNYNPPLLKQPVQTEQPAANGKGGLPQQPPAGKTAKPHVASK